jgi:hypothetical protein
MTYFHNHKLFFAVAAATFGAVTLDSGLSGGEACNGNTERAAGNIRHAGLVEELDGSRIGAYAAAIQPALPCDGAKNIMISADSGRATTAHWIHLPRESREL